MSDEIRALTTRLAEEPASLAFLELAEALRRRGQLDAAAKVARGGVQRYPGLADAHDLLARILSDQGDLAGAFDGWATVLQLDPMRASALKGIAFLYFRAGDPAAAVRHLERALEADPDDASIPQAIARVSGAARAPAPSADAIGVPAPPPAPSAARRLMLEELEADGGLLLVDGNGQRLTGRLRTDHSGRASDRVAAQLAGVSHEAARATRLLGLGAWHGLAVESADGMLYLAPATAETVLLVTRDHAVPAARIGLLAERAVKAAREWLEAQA